MRLLWKERERYCANSGAIGTVSLSVAFSEGMRCPRFGQVCSNQSFNPRPRFALCWRHSLLHTQVLSRLCTSRPISRLHTSTRSRPGIHTQVFIHTQHTYICVCTHTHAGTLRHPLYSLRTRDIAGWRANQGALSSSGRIMQLFPRLIVPFSVPPLSHQFYSFAKLVFFFFVATTRFVGIRFMHIHAYIFRYDKCDYVISRDRKPVLTLARSCY